MEEAQPSQTLVRSRSYSAPNIGKAPADIQAFVGDGVHVTVRVAAQFRSLSDFDVAQYGPRSHGDFISDIMIADHLECLRSALVAILTIGLTSEVADDVPCLHCLLYTSPSPRD